MSYLIRNKKTGVETWVEQETLDQITDLKMWSLYERISPTNAKPENKPVSAPLEVVQFINNKKKYKSKK